MKTTFCTSWIPPPLCCCFVSPRFSFPHPLLALITCDNTLRRQSRSRWTPATLLSLKRPASGNRWPGEARAPSYMLTARRVSCSSAPTRGACPTCWVDKAESSSGSEDSSPRGGKGSLAMFLHQRRSCGALTGQADKNTEEKKKKKEVCKGVRWLLLAGRAGKTVSQRVVVPFVRCAYSNRVRWRESLYKWSWQDKVMCCPPVFLAVKWGTASTEMVEGTRVHSLKLWHLKPTIFYFHPPTSHTFFLLHCIYLTASVPSLISPMFHGSSSTKLDKFAFSMYYFHQGSSVCLLVGLILKIYFRGADSKPLAKRRPKMAR